MSTFVAASGGQWITTSGSVATSFPTGSAAADRVFLWFHSVSTFTTPAGWTEVRRTTNATVARTTVLAYRDFVTGDTAPSITISAKGAWNMITLRKTTSTNVWSIRSDLDATDTTTGTTITPPAATGVASGDASILFTAGRATTNAATAITTAPPTSWTEPTNGDQSTASGTTAVLRQVFSAVSYQLSLSAGTVTPGAVTFSGSSASSATHVILAEVLPPALVGTLTDTFTSQDSTKWQGWSAGSVEVASSRLQVACTLAYPTLTSSAQYNLTGSALLAEIVQTSGVGGTTDTALYMDTNTGGGSGGIALSMLVENTTMYMRYNTGAGNNDTSTAYNATNHRWWRISESSGTVTWATSPDGTTWTTQRTATPGINVTSFYVHLQAGYWGTETSPRPALFDNVNTPPGAPPATTFIGWGWGVTV